MFLILCIQSSLIHGASDLLVMYDSCPLWVAIGTATGSLQLFQSVMSSDHFLVSLPQNLLLLTVFTNCRLQWVNKTYVYELTVVSCSTLELGQMALVSHCTLQAHVLSRSVPLRLLSVMDVVHATTMQPHSASGCQQLIALNSLANHCRRHWRLVIYDRRSAAAKSACGMWWLAFGVLSRTFTPTKLTTPTLCWTRLTPANMVEASLALASRRP